MKSVARPVGGCPETVHKPGILREKFMYRHWKSKIEILQKILTPLLRCNQYMIHMPEASMGHHSQTDMCNRATEMQLQRKDVEISQRSGDIEFSLYVREWDSLVEGVEQLKYMGRTLE